MKSFVFSYLFLIFLSVDSQAQEKITLESIATMPSVGSSDLSPNGDLVVYTMSRFDPIQNTNTTELIVQNLKSGAKEVKAENVSDPQWSPDGRKIAFRTKLNNIAGIYYITMDDNTPQLVAEVVNSNHFLGHPTQKNYAWSPDGKSIAYVSADPNTGTPNVDPNSPKIIERLLYKSRTSFSDNMITKIYVKDLAGTQSRIVTNDDYDSHSLTWGPDSKQIAYISNHTKDVDFNYNNDVFIVNLGDGKVKQVTNSIGTEHNPQWSPDGKFILYSATIRDINTKDSPSEDPKLYIFDVQLGVISCLTTDLDERIDAGSWASDSKSYYFGFPKNGKRVIYKGTLNSNIFTPIIDQEAGAGRFAVVGNKMIFMMSNPSTPNELYITENAGKTVNKLTNYASDWLKNKEVSKTESFWFNSFDGVKVQGFISYPANFTGKIPLIHRIHGGPHGAFGYNFTDIAEVMVAKGYAVISINPRGSVGYGQQFSDGTYQAWGGGDYLDLMKGIDYALIKYSFIDEDRMGVTGGSYGGFMTNWVITQTNRYKAAVTSASVSNLISFYGTSIYQDLIETEFNGMPWDNYALLWHFSPMSHIKNVKTPTLLLHGESDMDVPITQAEEFYIGLKKLEVPTRFVRYPNEGHGFSLQKNRLHSNHETLNWFDKHLKTPFL